MERVFVDHQTTIWRLNFLSRIDATRASDLLAMRLSVSTCISFCSQLGEGRRGIPCFNGDYRPSCARGQTVHVLNGITSSSTFEWFVPRLPSDITALLPVSSAVRICRAFQRHNYISLHNSDQEASGPQNSCPPCRRSYSPSMLDPHQSRSLSTHTQPQQKNRNSSQISRWQASQLHLLSLPTLVVMSK